MNTELRVNTINNNNNNNNVASEQSDQLNNLSKDQLIELVQKLQQNDTTGTKRKLEEKNVTHEDSSKKQKINNTIIQILPNLKKSPHFSEKSTIILYQKDSHEPLEFEIPHEALICVSKTYKELFEHNNQMTDIQEQVLKWNDPIQGPFYSPQAVEHICAFAFALSRNFKKDLSYKPLKEQYSSEQIDDMLEDLLSLISVYGLDEKLEEECADYIYNRIAKDRINPVDYFVLSYRYPLEKVQRGWKNGISVYDSIAVVESFCDLLENDEIKKHGLTHTYQTLFNQLASFCDCLFCTEVKSDLDYKLNEAFFERYFRNVVQLLHNIHYPDLPPDLPKYAKRFNTPFARLISAIEEINKKEDSALEKFNEILADNSKNSYALTNRGVYYFQKQNFEAAIKDLEEALSLNPEDFRAFLAITQSYLQLKKFSECWKNLELAFKLAPNSVILLEIRAQYYFYTNQYQKALDDLDLIKKRGKEEPFCDRLRAAIYSKMKRYDEALREINEYLKAKIDNSAYQIRGKILFCLNRYQEACQDFDKVLSSDLTDLEALYFRAKALSHSSKKEELKDALGNTESYLSKQKDSRIYVLRGTLYDKLGKKQMAWQMFQKAYLLNRNNKENLWLMSNHLYQEKKLIPALHYINEVLEASSTDHLARCFRAEILFRLGKDPHVSLNELEKALTHISDHAYYRTVLGEIYLRLGNLEKASEQFENVLKLNPKCEKAFLFNAKIKLQSRAEEKEVQEIESKFNTIKKFSSDFLKGEILFLLGKKQEALKALRDAACSDPDNVDVYLLKAKLCKELDLKEEAISDCSMVLLYQPENLDVLKDRAVLYQQTGRQALAEQDQQKILTL